MKTLVIDVGNSHLHIGTFDNGYPISNEPDIRKHDDLEKIEFKSVEKIYLSCGINEIADKIKDLASKNGKKVFEINSNNQIFILDTYKTLGIDRVCNLIGALKHKAYNGSDYVVVFDFGTATTVTVCDKERKFLGGLIKAGIQTELKSLSQSTKTLPNVLIKDVTLNAFAMNTEDAILSGVILDHLGFIEKYLNEFENKYKAKPKIFFTGGNSKLISKLYSKDVCIDNLLTLNGIYYAAEEIYSHTFAAK